MAWLPHPLAFLTKAGLQTWGKEEEERRRAGGAGKPGAPLTDPILAHGVTSGKRPIPPGLLSVLPLQKVRSQEAHSARKRLEFFRSVARAGVREREREKKLKRKEKLSCSN